jgi:hypothetical protein
MLGLLVYLLVWRNMLPRAWGFAMKLKVHGTLPRTGLLAGSGGFAGVEESARQFAAGNWDQIAAGNWEKAGGHRTLPRTGLLAGSGGFAGVEESARQLDAGNWNQVAAGNWGKAGGHRTLSGVIICCKRWSRSCWGKCPTARCW